MDTEKDTGRAGLQLHLQKYWRVLAVLLVLMVAVCVRSDEQSLEQARGGEPFLPIVESCLCNVSMLNGRGDDAGPKARTLEAFLPEVATLRVGLSAYARVSIARDICRMKMCAAVCSAAD